MMKAASITVLLGLSGAVAGQNELDSSPTSSGSIMQWPLKRKVARMSVASGPNGTYTLHNGAASAHVRRLQDEVPIYGDFRELAYYYADVFVGTPPQKFTVITDTGSTLMAFPCYDCRDCGRHMDPKYDPRQSSTSHAVSCRDALCRTGSCSHDGLCQYQQSYAEGSSLNGVFYTDAVYIGDDDNAAHGAQHAKYGLEAFKFGCHRHEGGLFTGQMADGIMGLGSGENSIIPALWASNKLQSYVFSLCMSAEGGALTLGQVDTSLHSSPVKWAGMSVSGFYVVSVAGFALTSYGSASDVSARRYTSVTSLPHAPWNSPHTIVDSGTTFTYIPSSSYNALRSAIDSFCSGGGGRCRGTRASVRGEPLCYRLESADAISSFPGALITLAGHAGGPSVEVDVPPHQLFVNMGWDG